MVKFVFATVAVIGGLAVLLVMGASALRDSKSTASTTTSAVASTTKYDWSAYEVRIEGERISINGLEKTDVEFKGGCLVSATDGSNESKSISGTSPQTYSYVGRGISCNYQKQRNNDEKLKVTVRRDGQIVKTIDTTTAYGVVSFAI